MKQLLLRWSTTFGVLAFLSLWSFQAAAQCNPVVKDRDGNDGKSATYCEDELVPFYANSPGYTTTITWDFGDGTTSNQQNPGKSYSTAGTYTVKFTGTGGAGNCSDEMTITIKRSPKINVQIVNSDFQCFEGNNFCFVDSSRAVPNSSIIRMTYVFSDGERIDTLNPTFPVSFCKKIQDPSGGFFDLVIESEDANGCVSRQTLADYFYVNPKLGIEFKNITPAPNPGCDSTLGRFENISLIPLKNIASFCWYWGDGSVTCGDSVTNTEFWNGINGDGVMEHMYRTNGTFDGKLVVQADYDDCKDSFIWKAAVTNIVLRPVILADKDSSCTADNPVCFSLLGGPPAGASAWLWNFGDPPSGPANFDDENWDPCHSYGTGPWMISLRIIAGPCDVTVYDTITKIGPGSTIEVPGNRVLEKEAYQCVITDSVHFPNNSAFYHNDPTPNDEDSLVFYCDRTWKLVRTPSTGADSIVYTTWEEVKTGNKVLTSQSFAKTSQVSLAGVVVFYDQTKDSIGVIENGDTTFYEKRNGYGQNCEKRYVFNFRPTNASGIGTGDQTAIPPTESIRGYDPHVWRVWDFGDRFAPQCTTDSRPWVNKNVGINCNWSIDSNPTHWYTPWDEIYRTFRNGQFYTRPYAQTRLHKGTRQCYQVQIYPAGTMVVPGDTILTIPYDSVFTYMGHTFYAEEEYPGDTFNGWIVRRPKSAFVGTRVYYDANLKQFVAVNDYNDTTYHDPYRLGFDSLLASTTWTVTFYDMDFWIPAGVTIEIQTLAAPGGGGAGNGNSRKETGPKKITIKKDEQFIVMEGDSIIPLITIEENLPDTSYAQPSNYIVDTVIFGVPTTITKQAIFVDSALHREQFFLDNGTCFQVSLWHKDTVHDFQCESTANKSLALIPPSAKGLEWTGGIPCPLDGANLSYFLTFDMGETKPGCSQQWFAINYDSLADPTNFINYKSGGVLAPPPPGSPLPFILPYQIVGSYGNQFVKGYTPGEIGNDPALRQPNGSFTLGLIVGNGQPDPNGGPPACMDTFWYNDMFRILYLNADFTIVSPDYEPKTICAGGTAYFRIDEPIQDSISTLRWAWGYQGIGRGTPNALDVYIEQTKYYQEYTGPVKGRNDENVNWNGEKWLYNYVIRQSLNDVLGLQTLDTIVTTIIKDWRIVANTRNADQLVKDAFQSIGLYYNEVPPEDIPYYLGDGTFGCIDTSGLSQYFTFGIKAYSEKVDLDVWVNGNKRMRCLDYSPAILYDTVFALTPTGGRIASQQYPGLDSFLSTTIAQNFRRSDCVDSMEVAMVLHFRDSSLRGFDSLLIDTNFDGQKEWVHGLWRKDYMYPEIITPDPCYPDQKDTIYKPANGPMVPTLFLNNTVGCEKRGAKLLNVGFLNDFWLDNENICNGLVVRLEDTLRYWQYGEQDPPTYPIFPYDFWYDFNRYTNNRETFEADWDESDGLGPIWERSLSLNHIYDEPGEYTITVVSKDSMNCRDTVRVKAFITDVLPNFVLTNDFLNCATFVDFQDSTLVIDPCAAKDTCTTGVKLSCDSIVKYEWDFGDGTRKSLLQNPTHDYTRGGFYDVKLKVWTALGCVDSIVQRIYIPGPQPLFQFNQQVWNDQDSAIICVGDSIILQNLSGGDKIDPEWEMRWGDGAVSNPGDSGTFFGHQYNKPGTFELYLVQFDKIASSNVRCSRIFPDTNPDLINKRKIKVVVLPRAPADMTISDTIVCPNELITFTANTDTLYTRYIWNFGDGDTTTRFFPDSVTTHSYKSSGIYNIRLIPDYTPPQFTPKCVDTAFGRVTVVTVVADFAIDSVKRPEFCFTNKSTGATSYEWTFEDIPTDGSSTDVDPCYNWGDERGTFKVCLIATSPEGCKDTFCDYVRNTFIRRIVPYNVFTPSVDGDGDGLNDVFKITGEGLTEYNIKIFNRWGERVFESNSIDVSWNGQVNNDGAICPEGTYFYIINYTFLFGEENEGLGPIEGTVDIIR